MSFHQSGFIWVKSIKGKFILNVKLNSGLGGVCLDNFS